MSIGKNCAFFAGGMIAGAALLGVQSVRLMCRNEVIMDAVKREVKDTVRRKAAEAFDTLYFQQRKEHKARREESDEPAWLQRDSSFCFCFDSLEEARTFRGDALHDIRNFGAITVEDAYLITKRRWTQDSMSYYGWDDIRDFVIKPMCNRRGNIGFSYYIQLPVPKRI